MTFIGQPENPDDPKAIEKINRFLRLQAQGDPLAEPWPDIAGGSSEEDSEMDDEADDSTQG